MLVELHGVDELPDEKEAATVGLVDLFREMGSGTDDGSNPLPSSVTDTRMESGRSSARTCTHFPRSSRLPRTMALLSASESTTWRRKRAS